MARIFVCGDIVCKYTEKQFISDDIINKIKSADYAVANLEGPIYDGADNSTGVYQNKKSIKFLKEAGFSLLLLANNHIGDYGKSSLNNTIHAIEYNEIGHIGAGFDYDSVYQPKIVSICEKLFAFINICEAQPYYYHSRSQKYGYAWIGDPNIGERIKSLKKKVDYVVAFVHAGLEHYSIPLQYFKEYYHWLVDIGVDSVVCSHPHIPQGIERYNGSIIVYSLGNFYFHPYIDESMYEHHENSSYSIFLNFSESSISYDYIYHHRIVDKVCLTAPSNASFSVKDLSSIISSDEYITKHNEMIRVVYDSLVNRLYRGCLHMIAPSDSLITKLKTIILYLFFPKRLEPNDKASHRTFVNLIVNESYRYIVSSRFKKEYAPEE